MKAPTLFMIFLVLILAGCQSPIVTLEESQSSAMVTESAGVILQVETSPTPKALASAQETPTSVEVQATAAAPVYDDLTITILFDNHPYDPYLETAWGYAALVQTGVNNLLFDTGGNGTILLGNMHNLEIDPHIIERVILSHAHGDHTNGLITLLSNGSEPEVYLLSSFPDSFKRQVENLTTMIEVEQGIPIMGEMYTTGGLGHSILEQSLVIRTRRGLVVITGCAHPGIVEIIEGIRETYGEPVYLVMGGFHLDGKSEDELTAIVDDFRRLGVEKVAPSHCTGGRAIVKFKEEYGGDFLMAGAGRVITLED
ncbi:MAG: MBL fold metallo-hydrolase [Anaerolineales bacterium]|jgi:7,8-dihydropterin-6-yl-methyl-4-(beta-D-ribofuranosyl)aminobenzene 5'-phosphate synthase